MRAVWPIRLAKYLNLATAIAFCVFGAAVIVFPDMSDRLTRLITGSFMVLFGGVKLFGYFSKDLYRLAFQYDLQLGATFVVIGAVLLASCGASVKFICILFGITVFVDSIFKIKIAADGKKFGIRPWMAVLILAILACVLGVVLLFRPSDNVRVWSVLFGTAFFEDGILNLTEKLCTVKIVKNQRPDSADRSDTEEEIYLRGDK